MTLLIASVFPVIIFLYTIYRKDHDKESTLLLFKCLMGGVGSVFLSLILTFFLGELDLRFNGEFMSSFYKAFFEAGIPEEISKFTFLYLIVWKTIEFNDHYDGIVYAVFVSLGFALIENILYVFQYGLGVAVMRGVLSVPGHGLFGVLMGYYFSLARFHNGNKQKQLLFLALIVPILFHGAFDFLLFYLSVSKSIFLIISLLIIFAGVVILLWRQGYIKIKEHIARDQLKH